MLVVIQAVLPVCSDVKVFPSVVVVIADADALAPACGRQTRLRGDIAKGSIVVVAVKVVGWAFAIGRTFERGSIHEEDVGPSVVVVIKDGDTCAGGFDNVFLRCDPAENIGESQAGLFGYIDEINRGLRRYRRR